MSASTTLDPHAAPSRSLAAEFSNRTQLPLVGGLILLLTIAAASVWLMLSNHAFNQAVAHTLEIRSEAYKLLTLVQDAETGQRGFVITRDEAYLKPYEIGRRDAPLVLASLRQLTKGSQVQTETLGRLADAMDKKFRELAFTVDKMKAGDAIATVARIKSNIGKAYMDTIRTQVMRIEDEEIRVQNRNADSAELNGRLLVAVSLAGVVLVIAFAAYAIFASNRSTQALLKAQDDLRHTNENLEGIVTERVSELQVANEEIQRFAYIVSHDLRAPLVNVMGFTSELDAARIEISDFLNAVEAKAPELVTTDCRMAIETDLPEALGFIRTSTAKMDRLINAILKLSREGRRVLTPQTIDVAALVEAQKESLMQQLDAASAELTVQDDLPPLTTDRLAVEQIFGNLIENAVKYLSPDRPGRIAVTGKAQGAYRRYDIADNGRGIEAKDFERVFELFRRSGEQNTPGEGIGLAYVRNLARRLGGNVTVQSEFGQGSTFTVILPAAYAAPTQQNARTRSK